MNAPSPMARWLALLLGAWSLGVHAAEAAPPGEARLREAIGRGLDFLVREGDTWMNEKDCNACHHMPVLLWSQREAKRRGFAIDQARLDEFTEWTDARAKKADAGLEMMAFLKLAVPDRPVPEVTRLIVTGQQADGSWKLAGQFASMQRRDAAEAKGNSARLLLLALATQAADQPAAEAARTKAAALLGKNDPAKSVETLAFRLLYARRFGPAEDADARRAEILRHQHADGGWAFMIGEEKSDPLATGEVLYVLQQSPDAAAADAITRAREWLLGNQGADGAWPIDITRISRIDRSAPAKSKSFKDATGIYVYWGSAWATIGLLQGVPVVGE